MPRKRKVRRPSHDEIMALAGPMDAFLVKMMAAVEANLATSRCGLTVSGHQKYLGEIQYHQHCISCIRWLLSHTQSWVRNRLTYDTDTDDGNVV